MSVAPEFNILERQIRDVVSAITSVINGILSDILAGLSGIVNNIRTFITEKFLSFQSILFGQLQNLKNELLGIFAGLPSQVASLLGGIQNALAPLISSITNTIQNLFASISNTLNNVILPFLQNLGRNISNGISAVAGTINQIITPVVQQIQSAVTGTNQFLNNLPSVIFDQLQEWSTFIQSEVRNVGNNLKQDLTNLTAIGATNNQSLQNLTVGFNNLTRDVVAGFLKVGQDAQESFLFQLSTIQNTLGGLKAQFLDPLLGQIQSFPQTIQAIIKPTGSITPEDARTMLFAAGGASLGAYVSANIAGVVMEFATAGQVDEIIRGVIDTLDDTGVDVFATDLVTFDWETGVKPALTREVLRRYTPMIPGAGDLVNMVVKEAFVPELRTPAPEIFATNLKEQGFDRFWSDTFWTAHWNPIDLDRITEMFHRGIIDENDFIRRMVILDFRPDDTEIMKELLFKLPNRIEARLMARFGLLPDELLNEIIRAQGIREDFVEPLRVMMQEFSLTSIFSRTETEAIRGFEKGLLNEAQVVILLEQIKRPSGIITADLALMRLRREMDFREAEMKAITKNLRRGNITSPEAEQLYLNIGVDAETIALQIGLAEFEQSVGTSEKVKSAAPKLTSSQIAKGVKEGLIPLGDGLSAMEAKGYDPTEAEILFRLAGAITT